MTESGEKNDLLQVLMASNCLSQSAMTSLREFMQSWSVSAFDALLECHIFSEQKLAEIIAFGLGLPTLLTIDATKMDSKFLRKLPYRDAKTYSCLPLAFDAARKIGTIAVSDPTRPMLATTIQKTLGAVEMVLVPQGELIRAIDEYYPLDMQLPGMCQR